MVDIVKASFDVSLHYPLRRASHAQSFEALLNSVMARPFLPETEGVVVGGRFGDRFKRQQIQRLHGSVLHRRNTEWTSLTVCFRDIDPSQRLGLVPMPSERLYGFGFRIRS